MSFISQLLGKFFGKEEYRVLALGLDASGKTSVLYRLKLGEITTTIPTIGFNVETVQILGHNVTIWDVGGCDKIRPLYRHYFANTQGLIWMVDSNDHQRIEETSEELAKVLRDDEMRDVALLVFANKQDLPGCMSVSEITDKLGLHALRNRKWFIKGVCATRGDISEVYDGMEWLVNAIDSTPFTHTPNHHTSTTKTTLSPAPIPAPTPSTSKSTGKARITKEEKEKAREVEQEALFLKWIVPDKDTTDEFLAKLEAGEIVLFDHRTLLRTIWCYISTSGRRVGIKKIFEQLSKYYTKAPTIKNNETWTYFWIQMVHYAMEVTRNPSGDFIGFLFMNPLMMNQRMPYGYYSKKVILGTEAVKNVVLPDKRPLPSIVPKAYNPAAHSPAPPQSTNSTDQNSTTTDTTGTNKTTNPAQVDNYDVDDKLTDDKFLANFEVCNLHKWDHYTHLRVAWSYITKFGRKEGSDKIFAGIENFIKNSKISRKTTFHLTMTFFWIQMVDIAIQSSPPNIPFDEFMKLNPQLMDGGLFLQYYKKETMLNNIVARKEFVLPDIKPLPTYVPKKQ